ENVKKGPNLCTKRQSPLLRLLHVQPTYSHRDDEIVFRKVELQDEQRRTRLDAQFRGCEKGPANGTSSPRLDISLEVLLLLSLTAPLERIVNAEVDSMGGGIDGRLGISSTFSPQQSTNLEKTQAELSQHQHNGDHSHCRQMFTAAEQFRRELEFLQKGGNPLDLKTASAASVSVQSTSLTDLHQEQFVTSEAKGSFAVTASPHGDSVGSSGRLGGPSVCEPNSADNLVLFGGDSKFRELEKRSVRPPTSNISPSKHCSLLDSGQNARESGDSAALELPKKSYKRRIRSRPIRDGARSSSSDAALSRGGQLFFPFHHASRDGKGLVAAANQECNGLSSCNSKPKGSNTSVAIKNVVSNNRLDGALAVETTLGRMHGPSSAVSDANASQNPRRKQHDHPLKSDTRESSPGMDFVEPESFEGAEQDNFGGSRRPPCVDRQRANNFSILGQPNGFGTTGERKSMPYDGTFTAAISTKGLDSESSCTQTGQSLDVNNEDELPASPRNINCNGTVKQVSASNEVPCKKDDNLLKEKEGKLLNVANNNYNSCHRSYNEDGFVLKEEEGLKGSESSWQNELMNPVSAEGVKPNGSTASETERKPSEVLGSNSFPVGGNATGTPQGSNGTSFLDSTLPVTSRTDVTELSACSQNNLKLATKEHEESILEEARIIEAKRKRIAELSVSTLPLQNRQNSHWDFVLEEMSWLANDFAQTSLCDSHFPVHKQERLWKLTAAAQISRRVAYASQVRNQQEDSSWKQKEVAQTLGRAVLEFWHAIQVNRKELELQCLNTGSKQGLQGYAMKFLEYNSTHVQYSAAQVPLTPDLIYDVGIRDIAWEDNLTEGAWSSLQEEVGTSGYDAVAAFGSQDNAFEEDDEMRAGYLPGVFEGSKSSKATKKRRKNFKFYGARSYEMGDDLPFMQPIEKNIGTQPSVLSGKRSGGSLNVPIPTKHVRTASRQRVVGPFNAGTSSYIQAPSRTDASSGDTNSFQDEQSTPHGGSHIPNYMEAESVGDYEKQLQFDSVEVSDRPRKKKKAKHLGSSFDHRWQPDSQFQNDQKDHSKRRLDGHQLDSNGSNGLYIQHNMKKLKMKQSSDNPFDNLTPMAPSIPSPVTSQMSNMSNPKKFMELLVRDRGRKSKTVKIPAGQPGSGTPWSLFEDQFLVVLVHDMGPNWELISDAINSTLQVKCTFRNSKECKERHKILMDRNTGDGADSAEDSGSSQPYPSTLPGIPEAIFCYLFGSARQLFQRLQGPMEEDTLKSHFEKIITIGKKQYRRTQNENQDSKQLQQPHSSHTLALSQVSPNNLNGRPVLTPLELCDTIASTPDAPNVGHRGSHSGGLPISDQVNAATMLPGSSSSSSVPGSSNVVLGNDFSSASVPLNPSVR
ncbi:HAS subgroup, partial [Cynara cardunculus var. scolymus]